MESKMNDDPRYAPIEEILPAVMPAITRKEILKYYKKLIRHFGKISLAPVNRQIQFQQLYIPKRKQSLTAKNRGTARKCWASSKPTSGHHKGWGRMIHDASHKVFRYRHPSFRPHDGGHATLEREMAEYVMKKGWLTK